MTSRLHVMARCPWGFWMTKYRPEYCNRVVELGRKGASLTAMATDIGVCRNALKRWARTYPEFGEALQFARDCSLVWWEGQADKLLNQMVPGQNPSFNQRTRRKHRRDAWTRTQVCILQMERQFPKEYGRNS